MLCDWEGNRRSDLRRTGQASQTQWYIHLRSMTMTVRCTSHLCATAVWFLCINIALRASGLFARDVVALDRSKCLVFVYPDRQFLRDALLLCEKLTANKVMHDCISLDLFIWILTTVRLEIYRTNSVDYGYWIALVSCFP